MRILAIAALVTVLCDSAVFCQQPIKIAQLPAPANVNGLSFLVGNGATSIDCSTGGGSFLVTCKSNGTSYVGTAYSGGGSASSGAGVSGSITTSTSSVQIPFAGMGCVGVSVSGTWTGSLPVQQSNDGTNWQPADTLQQLAGKWQEAIGNNGRYYSGGFAAQFYRINGPTSTGTATVSLQTSPQPCNMYVYAIPGPIAGNGFFGGAVSATTSQATVADSIQGQKQADVFVIMSGITGSPSGCQLILQGSGDGTRFANSLSYTFTPANGVVSYAYTPNISGTGIGAMGLATQFLYFCSVYPSAGTIQLEITYK